VEKAINESSIGDKEAAIESFLSAAQSKSLVDARAIAKDILGSDVFWDCERMSFSVVSKTAYSLFSTVPRTREGYYHFTGGIEVSFLELVPFSS